MERPADGQSLGGVGDEEASGQVRAELAVQARSYGREQVGGPRAVPGGAGGGVTAEEQPVGVAGLDQRGDGVEQVVVGGVMGPGGTVQGQVGAGAA